MPKRYSTVEIKNGKVVFSEEVLSYFDNLRTEENSIWIDGYFDVLMKEENKTAEKFNMHHIRPCCTFKDETHKNRTQTKPLADKFNGNLIKLSIYNHFFAHYYLWKIFNNQDLKSAFQRMCGQRKYIDNLTEKELKEIATLKENCAKKNIGRKQTLQKYNKSNKRKNTLKRYYNRNKDKLRNKSKNRKNKKEYYKVYYKNNRDKYSEQGKKYRNENKTKISEHKKLYYKNNSTELKNKQKEYRSQICYDPKKENYCTLKALQHRKKRNEDLYKDVIPSQCIIQTNVPSM